MDKWLVLAQILFDCTVVLALLNGDRFRLIHRDVIDNNAKATVGFKNELNARINNLQERCNASGRLIDQLFNHVSSILDILTHARTGTPNK